MISSAATITLNGKTNQTTSYGFADENLEIKIKPIFSLLSNYDEASGFTLANIKLEGTNAIEGYIDRNGVFRIVKEHETK